MSVWAAFGHPTQEKTDHCCSNYKLWIPWLDVWGELWAIKHLEGTAVNFPCPPSCHCEAPSSLFSRFSSGLMKIEVFYGCWRHWICTRSLCCRGCNGWFVSTWALSSWMCVSACVCVYKEGCNKSSLLQMFLHSSVLKKLLWFRSGSD